MVLWLVEFLARLVKENKMADFDFSSLGSMFGGGMGGTPSGLDALLSEDQRKLLGRNATLSAAAALLQASGRGPQRIGLGQALGSALQAGQAGYEKARAGSFQDLLLGEKLKEAQAERARQTAYTNLFSSAAPGGLTPAQTSLAAPIETAGRVGPTPDRAALMTAAPAAQQGGPFSFLNQTQRALLSGMKPEQGLPEILKMSQAAEEYGTLTPVVMNGKTVMVQYNKQGQPRIAQGAMPYEALPTDVRAPEYLTGRSLAGTGQEGIGIVSKYRQDIAPKTNVNVPVNMTEGQKGFENEMNLSKAFKQEPIYKDYSDMQSAFGQVISSLSQGTPIGDVAGATKVMKLLDPGSVVRESELGIAMAASGRMDRLQNYFSNMMSGQKLTPTQREDFKALSNELYAVAGDAYNKKRKEFKGFGEAYGFKNLDAALGAPATIPSVMRTRPGAAGSGAGGATRPSLGNIFGVPGG
jgi:hypothetical protein